MPKFDAVVIGGGHNGLVAAAYLQKAGFRTLVVERRPFVGGCVATEFDVFPRHRVDTAAFVMGNLFPGIEKELRLAHYGLRFHEWDPISFHTFLDRKYIFSYRNPRKTAKGLSKFSERDARAFPKYLKFISRFAQAIEKVVWSPPSSKSELEDRLGKKNLQFLEMMERSAKDVMDEFFETDEVKTAFSWETAINLNGSPSSKGTGWNLGVGAVEFSKFRIPVGGIGELSRTLAKAALDLGVEIRTNVEVSRIKIRNGRATGVELKGDKKAADMKDLSCRVVLSDLDPKRTFQDLVSEEDVKDKKFKRRIESLIINGVGTKIICSLNGLPSFDARPGDKPGPQHNLFNIVPSLKYVEHAWEDARKGVPSKKPVISGYIPSLSDPSLVPKGRQLLALWAQYTPYNLSKGAWSPKESETYCETIFDTIEEYAPNFRECISHKLILTPRDFESRFFVTEGQSYHIDMQGDQRFLFSGNRTPIVGLYLCGAGCSPAGVNGAPGFNAAKAVIDDVLRKIV